MANPKPGTGGDRYIPYAERSGNESIVYFTRDLSPEGLKKIYAGMEVILTGELVGFEGLKYTLQWYYRENGQGDYIPIEGATGLTYTYIVTKENYRDTFYLGADVIEFEISSD